MNQQSKLLEDSLSVTPKELNSSKVRIEISKDDEVAAPLTLKLRQTLTFDETGTANGTVNDHFANVDSNSKDLKPI